MVSGPFARFPEQLSAPRVWFDPERAQEDFSARVGWIRGAEMGLERNEELEDLGDRLIVEDRKGLGPLGRLAVPLICPPHGTLRN